MAEPEEANQEGRKIGRYHVIRRLGEGGMGRVYLALDSEMGRHVALKFLSPDLADDPEMLKRLRTEGLTASSLNHPNILTIFEVCAIEGERFLVTEYVEGATLKLAAERGLIDFPTALDIVTQVASALVAAHAAGIIHRDLKPGNIMIRQDGYVKVIDFGLAKRVRRPGRRVASDLAVTRPGTIIGTVHYMSPEQAAGAGVDARSDIWSLGVILFELVTRRLPFDGHSETEVLENIRDRSVLHLPPGLALPPGTEALILRALAKNPGDRFQNARELLAALGGIHRPITHQSPRPFRIAPPTRRPWFVLIAGIGALLLAAGGYFAAQNCLLQPNWFQIDKVRQLTFNGRVTRSSLSPDGKYLAYVAGDPEGMQSLYLLQLNTATEQMKIPSRQETYLGVSFSPDDEIYAVSEGPDLMGKLYQVPLVGDAPEKPILVDIDGPVTFSPSGDHFAFVRYLPKARDGTTENAIFIANRNGTGSRKLASTFDAAITNQLAWSPFTNQIAAAYDSYAAAHSGEWTLHLLNLDGTENALPLPAWRIVGQPWWNDSRSVIVSAAARTEWSGQSQLQQLDTRTGKAHSITRDLAGYRSVSLSADRHLLAAVKTESRGSLWVSSPNNFARGQTSLAEVAKFPSLAWINQDRVMVDSPRGGFPNLWQVDVNNLARSSLTNEAVAEQDAVPVPGTHLIVLASNRSGQFKLWRFNPDTNTYDQLTFGPSYDRSPTVSPDGRWVVFTSWYSSAPHLRKVPVSGGASEPVGAIPAQDPQFSPDGTQIVCYAKAHVATFPFAHPDSLHIVPLAALPAAWSPDGQKLDSVMTDHRGVSNIWSVPLDGTRPSQITSFEDQSILKFAWSPNGDRLACLRASFGSDVALFTRSN